ncbi:hypothetical protein [Ornithinimicrobium panacihumi]|uniref:hypothetical protein n=1 Tax=Ornithinimicrobium panacihumi TaxID=2008449 RepID=UPI003F8C1846
MSGLGSAMKMISSALVLVLVGVLAAWLWFDATAVARQETAGVVVGVEVPGDGAQGGTVGAAEGGHPQATDRARQLRDRSDALNAEVAEVAAAERALNELREGVRSATDELAIAGDAAYEERLAAVRAAKERAAEKAAAEKAAAEKAAAEKAAQERAAREARANQPAPAPPPAPAPVPVNPPGMCWDDDEWEECDDDDWDDDWDDDDWDD